MIRKLRQKLEGRGVEIAINVVAALLILIVLNLLTPRAHTDPAGMNGCENQLKALWPAVEAYMHDHGGRLPRDLTELVPAYVPDMSAIQCPFHHTIYEVVRPDEGGTAITCRSHLAHDLRGTLIPLCGLYIFRADANLLLRDGTTDFWEYKVPGGRIIRPIWSGPTAKDYAHMRAGMRMVPPSRPSREDIVKILEYQRMMEASQKRPGLD